MAYLDSVWYNILEGKEPVLVFIHGYAMNSSVWQNQLEFFKNHKRIVLDLRGHGKSSGECSVEESAKDINLILEKEKIRKPILIGHSLGATICLMFNRMFPKRNSKIILINPYIKKRQLTLKSRFLFWLLNLLFIYPKFNLDHSQNKLFPVLRCVFSTRVGTLKFGKKEYFRDYDFELGSNALVLNSVRDSIIKSYFKGEFVDGKHILQVDKPERVNSLIAGLL